MTFILHIIQIFVTIGGPLGVLGAIYLYLEKKRLDRLEAEREWQVACAELDRLRREAQTIVESSRSPYRDMPRLNRSVTFLQGMVSDEILSEMDAKADEIKKMCANEEYWRKRKDHTLFWFLHK